MLGDLDIAQHMGDLLQAKHAMQTGGELGTRRLDAEFVPGTDVERWHITKKPEDEHEGCLD